MLQHVLCGGAIRRVEVEHLHEKLAQLFRVLLRHVVLLRQDSIARPKLERADVTEFAVSIEVLLAVLAREREIVWACDR